MKQPEMIELKFGRKGTAGGPANPSCCDGTSVKTEKETDTTAYCSGKQKEMPAWLVGQIMTVAGPVGRIETEISGTDRWEHLRCRISAFRNSYTVNPGLYAAGNPDRDSDVLVSANYKYSFDALRRELKGLDVWILVLDTKGINVWCAAGKGTFGTEELVKRIRLTNLSSLVSHKRIIVPQLGAPGVSAPKVLKATGFRVLYGPVRANDIPEYIKAGHKATREMRKVKFGFFDRLTLTPMEINPAMKNYILYALIVLIVFGLSPSGILFRDASAGVPFLILGLVSVLAGSLVTPILLPFIPFRSFAVKGWLAGMLSVLLSMRLLNLNHLNISLEVFTYIFFPVASSYIALQFTGSTTFTGMSGVKKELKIAVPLYLLFGSVSTVIMVAYKLAQWRVL
jgi:hypothetical protein